MEKFTGALQLSSGRCIIQTIRSAGTSPDLTAADTVPFLAVLRDLH
jgi:hypothetical protein